MALMKAACRKQTTAATNDDPMCSSSNKSVLDVSQSPVDACSIGTKLRAGFQRLANVATGHKGGSCENQKQSNITSVNLFDESSCSAPTILKAASQCLPINGPFLHLGEVVFVRIELYGTEQIDTAGDGYCLETAITLHNYGLSCLCLSTVAETSSQAYHLKRNALQILDLAQKVLSIRTASSSEEGDDHATTTKILSVAVIVTNSMVRALAAWGADHEQIGTCVANLAHLGAALEEHAAIGAFFGDPLVCHRSAPAA